MPVDKKQKIYTFKYLFDNYFIMKKWSSDDLLQKFIYNSRPLYKKNPVYEKDIKDKSVNKLIILKESEHDYLSINIPLALWLLWILTLFNNIVFKIIIIVVLIIICVNISVAFKEKRENIEIYNKVILKKMKEHDKKEEKFKKDVLQYLKQSE